MDQKKDRRQPDTRGARRPKKPAKKRRSVFLPVLLGITVAFALACGAMCWSILQDSSNLMNEKNEAIRAAKSWQRKAEQAMKAA